MSIGNDGSVDGCVDRSPVSTLLSASSTPLDIATAQTRTAIAQTRSARRDLDEARAALKAERRGNSTLMKQLHDAGKRIQQLRAEVAQLQHKYEPERLMWSGEKNGR